MIHDLRLWNQTSKFETWLFFPDRWKVVISLREDCIYFLYFFGAIPEKLVTNLLLLFEYLYRYMHVYFCYRHWYLCMAKSGHEVWIFLTDACLSKKKKKMPPWSVWTCSCATWIWNSLCYSSDTQKYFLYYDLCLVFQNHCYVFFIVVYMFMYVYVQIYLSLTV